jgi:propanol-preferring alcohol dehydrogenase
MLAIQLQEWNSEPRLVEVEKPTPGPGEVLIRVEAAGLCHSDLHLMDWPEGTTPFTLPFTLGHETAGTVAALGPGSRGARVGDRVLVHSLWGCGECWQCLQGAENRCEAPLDSLRGFGGGVGCDGGLAEYMLVPSRRHLTAIDDLDPVAAAPLADAALTPYHAIKLCAHQLRPGATVVVIGVGGIGHMAVQLLRALSPVRILAVDVRDEALALAESAGAHVTVSGDGLTGADLRAQVGARGATLVLDCVASDATLALACGAVGRGADICYIGRAGGALPVAPSRLPLETTVRLPSWGTLPELAEVVALARAGVIRTEVQTLGLEEVVEGYRRLRRGEIRGRAVATPAPLTSSSSRVS